MPAPRLPLMVLLLIVNVASGPKKIPPPAAQWPGRHRPMTVFPLIVLLLIVSVPTLSMPPPAAEQPGYNGKVQ